MFNDVGHGNRGCECGADCGLGTERERASAMMLSFPATQVMEKS